MTGNPRHLRFLLAFGTMAAFVLIHAIGAFFYNTVILAPAVNAGLALGRWRRLHKALTDSERPRRC